MKTAAYIGKLNAAGIDLKTAQAHGEALEEALAGDYATRADFARLEQKFDGKFLLLQWMLGFNLLMTAGILWRMLK